MRGDYISSPLPRQTMTKKEVGAGNLTRSGVFGVRIFSAVESKAENLAASNPSCQKLQKKRPAESEFRFQGRNGEHEGRQVCLLSGKRDI